MTSSFGSLLLSWLPDTVAFFEFSSDLFFWISAELWSSSSSALDTLLDFHVWCLFQGDCHFSHLSLHLISSLWRLYYILCRSWHRNHCFSLLMKGRTATSALLCSRTFVKESSNFRRFSPKIPINQCQNHLLCLEDFLH